MKKKTLVDQQEEKPQVDQQDTESQLVRENQVLRETINLEGQSYFRLQLISGLTIVNENLLNLTEAIKNLKMVEAARTEAKALIEKDPDLEKSPELSLLITSKYQSLHFE